MKFFDHQITALEALKSRLTTYKSAYYAAQPGLGKTAVALELGRLSGLPVVYVCPPSLARNVRREIEIWAPEIVSTIIPDSQLNQRVRADQAFLIIDEAHRFKNLDALRTKRVLTLAQTAARVLLLSGTPLPNSRALEIWPLVSNLAPDVFKMRKWAFLERYCAPSYSFRAGRRVQTYEGLSHAQEFYGALTKSWMVRQDKTLLTLPPKLESLVLVGDASTKLAKLDALARASIGQKTVDGPVATYRRELGLEKLALSLDWLKDQIAGAPADQAFLVFAHHKQVLATLAETLEKEFPGQVISIVGDTPIAQRQALVDRFQSPTGPRIAILSIQASGVGHTLTKADRVVFVESDWLDGVNEQAADRSHRIGQRRSVYIQYLILEGTYDAEILTRALDKRKQSIDYYHW